MKSIYKLILLSWVVLGVSCYNDYDDPQPDQPYTDADFKAEGLDYISIKELKRPSGARRVPERVPWPRCPSPSRSIRVVR